MTLPAISDDYPAHWLQPEWSLPGVRAWCTTRYGDCSQPPYDGFNTANHVGDDPASVAACRAALSSYFQWHSEPQWLRQVHGTQVVEAQGDGLEREADGVYSRQPGQVCTLHTADCLPAFFASAAGDEVALAHAGWRGLADGVLEATLQTFQADPAEILVWLGPAISQPNYEVGDDVRDAFLQQAPHLSTCFERNPRQRWQCDLVSLARARLQEAGVRHISGGRHCTFGDPRFFSFRRQPVTGRLLSLIWIDPAQ
ncbi:peptidoglycan editing factor PgeF [Ketobacter sp.]|uniref:peptidoglycan editing factor PgeF n=1 Tax=Ketobacter sp. TaxID=2083498 RepID=UPI000F271AAB|nr:peptidoglycan editing factor PgeF [Ketobacter sp.]RLU00889.1 MAG: peptidoglycan editing factor PgeF [Ketobacter sp.]